MLPDTEDDTPVFKLSFIDLTQHGGEQDNLSTFTNIEALLNEVKLQFLHTSQVILVSDNATTFAFANTIPFIVRLNQKMNFSGLGLCVSRYHYNEAKRGRGMLDTHFLLGAKLRAIFC